ncbi:flagellar motor protein MotB [Cellvibrio fibrivorans]|uniref:Chemotaxis protein MotB n=1 Tax=Cellvibrio fibrivorans TaxID=126350 RepID=A0ABU1V2N9_9GAMM|nr:flagellar motor protein MotB [Cellvibrio fibrivorans]MDR7091613.1 chemotaxis protein MotB [Cellvibrio fibrivorans]
MEKGANQQPIIIKKKKGHGHGHHGGSWKVALADFMTALMAFFLLMWLLGSTSSEEQKAIAAHFKDPGSKYVVGEGGADLGLITQDKPLEQTESDDPNDETANDQEATKDLTEEELQKELERIETQQLEELKKQLETEINALDSVFQQIKDQILIDFTALGLRIQIVDKDQRPMFDVGSANLQQWSSNVLNALAPILDKVQNKISVTGHTDATPYGVGATYTNWELSADRANAARRALLEGSYPEGKVATVQGMGSAAPLVVDKPGEPINRRIAIIVLKKAVADALGSGAGIDSSQLMKSGDTFAKPPVQSQPAGPKILSPTEVDDAIDAANAQ